MAPKRSGMLQSGTDATKNKGWVSLVSPPDSRAYESLLYRSVVLLAAGTVAVVGFAACASLLGRKRLAPPPGKALPFARRELRRLAAPRK